MYIPIYIYIHIRVCGFRNPVGAQNGLSRITQECGTELCGAGEPHTPEAGDDDCLLSEPWLQLSYIPIWYIVHGIYRVCIWYMVCIYYMVFGSFQFKVPSVWERSSASFK